MKRWIAIILIAPILGAVLGYILVYALTNGWFHSKWQVIEKPPSKDLQLAGLSGDSIWVQSDTGKIYYNEHASTCQTNCWQEVPEFPDLPAVETDESTVTSEACGSSLPLFGVTQRISECRSTLWVDYIYTFALRRDGSIYLWQAELFKEWTVILLLIGVCGGAIAFFILALVSVLVLKLLSRRSKNLSR